MYIYIYIYIYINNINDNKFLQRKMAKRPAAAGHTHGTGVAPPDIYIYI